MNKLTAAELTINIELLKGYVTQALQANEFENAAIYLKSIEEFTAQLIDATVESLVA